MKISDFLIFLFFVPVECFLVVLLEVVAYFNRVAVSNKANKFPNKE
jgi:hypothetical protein